MKARTPIAFCAAVLLMAVTLPDSTTAAQAPGKEIKPPVPLKVDVVLTRYQGEKKVASLPFTMWVNATDKLYTGMQQTTLRMGVDVPVGTISATRATGANNSGSTTTTGPDFRNVGTSIDCWAFLADGGRFEVGVRLTDSSIFTADQEGRAAIRLADPMAFRTFSTSNSITMRDGQTTQFAVATDKITGEIVKVDVTINSVK